MKFEHSIRFVGQYLFMTSNNNNTKSNSLSLAESVGSMPVVISPDLESHYEI